MTPALFTRPSTRPNASSAAASSCVGVSGSRRSSAVQTMRPPSEAGPSPPRLTARTSAPNAVSRDAIARPIPRLAPVTTCARPSSSGSLSSNDRDLLHRPLRENLDASLSDDDHFLDADALAPVPILRLYRKRHALFEHHRVIE